VGNNAKSVVYKIFDEVSEKIFKDVARKEIRS